MTPPSLCNYSYVQLTCHSGGQVGYYGLAVIWNTTTDDHVQRAGPGSGLDRQNCTNDTVIGTKLPVFS